MKIKYFKQVTNWNRALNAARQTVGKEFIDKEPSNKWIAKMLISEHSPIRLVEFDWIWEDIKQWVTVHLVRHHIGCEKFVSTQREDRKQLDVPRDLLPQGSENNMMMTANIEAIMKISHKRLCMKASPDTRKAWVAVVDELYKINEVLGDKCVASCVYRGRCPEMESCGYDKSYAFQADLIKYWKIDY